MFSIRIDINYLYRIRPNIKKKLEIYCRSTFSTFLVQKSQMGCIYDFLRKHLCAFLRLVSHLIVASVRHLLINTPVQFCTDMHISFPGRNNFKLLSVLSLCHINVKKYTLKNKIDENYSLHFWY